MPVKKTTTTTVKKRERTAAQKTAARKFAAFLRRHGACTEGYKAVRGMTAGEFVRTTKRGDWLMWLLSKLSYDIYWKLRISGVPGVLHWYWIPANKKQFIAAHRITTQAAKKHIPEML